MQWEEHAYGYNRQPQLCLCVLAGLKGPHAPPGQLLDEQHLMSVQY